MRILTDDEIARWCQTRGIQVAPWRILSYAPGDNNCVRIMLPDKPLGMIGLSLILTGMPEEASSSSSLLWMRDWGMWSEEFENIGLRTVQRFRGACQETRPLLAAPGHLFDATERVDLQAMLIQPMVYQWDAYLVPDKGDLFVLLSHDGFVDVVTRTDKMLGSVMELLRPWNPVTRLKEATSG